MSEPDQACGPGPASPAEFGRAPRPVHEPRRLERLEGLAVLGTPPEAFSDAVVVAAASIANVPMSAVTLVGHDRLWLKAAQGLGFDEVDRDLAFCAHAVVGTQPLVVDDATLDARFANNPMVLGPPFVRFYAGFPIVVGGESVGALCVIDDLARRIEPGQSERLQDLADGVAAWLVLRSEAGERAA